MPEALNNEGSIQSPQSFSLDGEATQTKPTGEVTGKTTISSMEDLKNKAPEVYNQMMMGIGMNICKRAQKGQQRIKEAMRKAREVYR